MYFSYFIGIGSLFIVKNKKGKYIIYGVINDDEMGKDMLSGLFLCCAYDVSKLYVNVEFYTLQLQRSLYLNSTYNIFDITIQYTET